MTKYRNKQFQIKVSNFREEKIQADIIIKDLKSYVNEIEEKTKQCKDLKRKHVGKFMSFSIIPSFGDTLVRWDTLSVIKSGSLYLFFETN